MLWLTITLVFITGYYAWQSHRMVVEMQRARFAAIEPRLVPVVEYDHAGSGTVYVENIGAGPALNIELVLRLEPQGATCRIRLHLLRSGARRLWNPARTAQQEILPQDYRPDAHLPHHTGIRLTGSCSDVLGRRHDIDERTMVLNRWETLFMGRWITGEAPPPNG